MDYSSIRSRMRAVIAIVVVVVVGLIAFNAWVLQDRIFEERKNQVRTQVESAHSLIAHWAAQQHAGLPRDEAQAAAMSAVGALRYDGVEYFWIHDLGKPFPRMVMHPTVPALDGKTLDDVRFERADWLQYGKDGDHLTTQRPLNLFVAFNEVVERSGEGYVAYDWPKPLAAGGVTSESYRKMSYVKAVPEWGWVVGSGIYVDDVWRVAASSMIKTVAVGTTFLLLVAVLIAGITTRFLNSIRDLNQTATRVVMEKDFSARSAVRGKDEIGQIAQAFNQVIDAMSDVIGDAHRFVSRLGVSGDRLRTSAEQTRCAAGRQSDAVSASAATVEQVAVSVAQITSNASEVDASVNEMALRVRSAGDTVEHNRMGAEALSEVLRSTADDVRVLSESSAQIGGIVVAIKEIAEQTNLLALNAAIEAARAGEHGRGFAVVADEVRKLSERSSMFAEQIGQMIGTIGERIDRSVHSMSKASEEAVASTELSRSAESELDAVARSAEDARMRVSEILLALREESAAMQSIAQNAEQVSLGATETLEAARESSHVAADLAELANALTRLIGDYRVAAQRAA